MREDRARGIGAPEPAGWRIPAVVLLATIEITVILILMSDLGLWTDTMEYWSAASVNLSGGNPYDPATMSDVQVAAGWENPRTAMMWNPPWTLPLVYPLAVFPYRSASLVWSAFLLGVALLTVFLSWRIYGVQSMPPGLVFALLMLFPPLWFAVFGGQIGPLIAVGLVGFLWSVLHGKDRTAGACLFLLTIKPHLMLLPLVAALLWSLREKRFRILASALLVTGAAALIPLFSNGDVWVQYVDRVIHSQPRGYVTTTFGAALRAVFGWDRFWLQFLPSALGMAWLISYWGRKQAQWSWMNELPIVILASVLTAAYGWVHDLVVLLPVLAQMISWYWLRSVRRSQRLLGLMLLAGGYVIVVLQQFMFDNRQLLHLWIAPAMLVGYLVLRRRERKDQSRQTTLSRQ